VIGELAGIDHVLRIGMDFNPRFLSHCKAHYPGENMHFIEQDVTKLTEWWAAFSKDNDFKYTKPLLICVNNTLNIMPEEIRGSILNNMIAVAGPKGRCVLSYWNGSFFSHAIMGFYSKNEALCGKFTLDAVDWDKCSLEAPSGYSTHWQRPQEVQKMMIQNDINLEIESRFKPAQDHINTDGLSIFVWFSANSTTGGKTYYDSDDAQKFYSSIWGEETIHIGRYDLLTDIDHKTLTKAQQISKAEDLHEAEFMQLITSKYEAKQKLRILDMGCGYGGLLRKIWKNDMVWSAVGCDIASKMCEKARDHNKDVGADGDIQILEESYLDVSVPDESMDLVLSMDALLHVGPDRQAKAMAEASRALRPYGWIIFSDIMQKEDVDAAEMQPIYDRIHLSKMGTVSNYKQCLEEAGFSNFEYVSHSENVASHYGTVREVLMDKKDSIGVSPEFAERMLAGLETWRDLAPKNIEWGFVMAQKTSEVNL
jgi:SAM-dependent methyltransferase